MKNRFLLLLCLLTFAVSSVMSQNIYGNCYRGFVDAGYTIGLGDYEFGRFEINTSQGYQINPHCYIGVGLGLHFMPEYKTPDMDIALDSRESSVEIPIFANLKLNFSKAKVTPFIDIKGGTYITNNGELYANFAAGCRITTIEKQALSISIGYTLQNIEFKTFDGFYRPSNMSYATEARILKTEGIAIKIGYEF